MEEGADLELPVRQQPVSLITRGRTKRQRPLQETQVSLEPEALSPPGVISSPDPAHCQPGEEDQVRTRGGRPPGPETARERGGPETRPVADDSRGHGRPGRRRRDSKGLAALPDPRPQAVLEHARPRALPDSRPQALTNSRPQPLPDSSPQALPDPRPQAVLEHARPQAHLDSRPQTLPNSRPQPLPDSSPQALPESRPQALPESRPRVLPAHTQPQSEETSETESEGSEGLPWEEASALGSFDEQRLLYSMIGRGLDHLGGPLPACQRGAEEGYCTHCGSRKQTGRRLKGILTPGPWVMPRKEKLLEIVDGSWLS